MSVSQPVVRLPFADRAQAGQLLAELLVPLGLTRPLVLSLPRGGVAVGHEIAARLHADHEVYVTRKIGYPRQPELGVGAIAEDGAPAFDERLMRRLGVQDRDLVAILAHEREELARRVAAYRSDRPIPPVSDRDVVLVDDGLATGVTARAALRALRERKPARLVLAVPVSAPETARAMRAEADDVVVLATPVDFRAVGQWYRRFEQLSDADVISLLNRSTTRLSDDGAG